MDHAIKLGKTAEPVLYSTADADDLVALKRVAVSNRVGLARADADADPPRQIALGPGGARGLSGGEGALDWQLI